MKLLFLGASNTDCGHCFTPDNLGTGYVRMAVQLLQQSGVPVEAINGGTDGFTMPRIYRKWESSWLGLSFDAVFILGGINEVGALMDSGCSPEVYQDTLRHSARSLFQLLHGLLESGCRRIYVMEPFLFDTPAYLRNWQGCLQDIRLALQEAVALFSQENHAQDSQAVVTWLPVGQALSQEAARCGSAFLTTDGIHLSEAGHQFLARYLARLLLPDLSLDTL